MAEIKQLDSKIVYQNKWMSVREDRILRPSGAEGIYGVVYKPDFVAILPIDNGVIHLVHQFLIPFVGHRPHFAVQIVNLLVRIYRNPVVYPQASGMFPEPAQADQRVYRAQATFPFHNASH